MNDFLSSVYKVMLAALHWQMISYLVRLRQIRGKRIRTTENRFIVRIEADRLEKTLKSAL